MKTVLIMSDSHGHRENIDALYKIIDEADYVVHLGDGVPDMREYTEKYPEKTYVCKGNCDLFPALKEWVLEVEGVRIFMCHGDRYRVKSDVNRIVEEAKKNDCSVVLHGHTHEAVVETVDGVLVVCPGTMKYPAELGGTYAYMTIGNGKAYAVIVGEKA